VARGVVVGWLFVGARAGFFFLFSSSLLGGLGLGWLGGVRGGRFFLFFFFLVRVSA